MRSESPCHHRMISFRSTRLSSWLDGTFTCEVGATVESFSEPISS